jgi:uncharacterized protein YwlG (UPF0340 family)
VIAQQLVQVKKDINTNTVLQNGKYEKMGKQWVEVLGVKNGIKSVKEISADGFKTVTEALAHRIGK